MKRITLLFLLSLGSIFSSMAQGTFGGGSGTVADPYILNTPAHFSSLSSLVNAGNSYAGKYFIMNSDVDFDNQGSMPIGNSFDGSSNLHYFNGIVDGQNHKIRNFNCILNTMGASIFGLTGATCIIKNIHMASGVISGNGPVGSIVGYNGGLIEHCSASDQVSVMCNTIYGGGIAGGNIQGAVISKCSNSASVLISGVNGMCAGGIAGGNNGTITQCINMGSVSATLYVGGIAGYSDKTCSVDNCYNGGAISASDGFAGGIGGALTPVISSANNKVENCYNFGPITGTNNNAICGTSSSMTFSNNHYNSATSTSSDSHGAGHSTATMTGVSFAATLNSGVSCWSEDVDNINSHYPILTWQATDPIPSGIYNAVPSTDFYAYSINNKIVVKLNEPINGSISIFNINGALVAQTKITDSTHSFTVGANGVYLIRIISPESYMTKKIVVTE